MSPDDLGEDPEIVAKYRNCLKFLNYRELGVIAGVQAKKEFYQMKTSHKEKASSYNLSIPYPYDSCEVRFINGDDESLFGIWFAQNYRKRSRYVMGRIRFDDMNHEGTFKQCHNIIDMCQGPVDLIIVSTYSYAHSPYFFDSSNVLRDTDEEDCPPPWYCCCYLHSTDSAVFGGDGYMVIIRSRGDRPYDIVQLPGKVCTVSHNDDSRILLLALDTGELRINDQRTDPDEYYSIKISDKAVNDSIFLNDQEVIVTNVQGKLVKVDLRTRKTSTMFFGHKHSATKRPFSVANNMLCATGVDNVVRIWHISGGNPIHIHKSSSGHEVRG